MLKKTMEASLDLWIEYILRFSHLVAGISWIGSSFYFIWLDSSFEPPEKDRHNVEGEVFMVHGGFYYQVDKKKIYPGELPKTLHWFKWEATLTFITGFLLFIYLYFLNDASLLINKEVLDLSAGQAIGLSLGLIIGSWFIYDTIYHPNFMKYYKYSNIIAFILAMVLIYGVTGLFSGRGAFIIVGVIFGSSMLFNVWVRILPGQAKMLKDAENGKVPDYDQGKKSKSRSVHNTYFIFPVLFIMISNHYPSIYNHEYNWLLLMILTIAGAMVRQAMITKKPIERWLVLPATIGLIGLVFLTARAPKLVEVKVDSVDYAQIQPIIANRCLSCHSTNNTDEIFTTAQKGVILETEDSLKLHREKIIIQAIVGKTMPLANKTQMTDEERALLNKYFETHK